MIWTSWVMNDTTADGLLRAVFYCNGKFLPMRWSRAQRPWRQVHHESHTEHLEASVLYSPPRGPYRTLGTKCST